MFRTLILCTSGTLILIWEGGISVLSLGRSGGQASPALGFGLGKPNLGNRQCSVRSLCTQPASTWLHLSCLMCSFCICVHTTSQHLVAPEHCAVSASVCTRPATIWLHQSTVQCSHLCAYHLHYPLCVALCHFSPFAQVFQLLSCTQDPREKWVPGSKRVGAAAPPLPPLAPLIHCLTIPTPQRQEGQVPWALVPSKPNPRCLPLGTACSLLLLACPTEVQGFPIRLSLPIRRNLSHSINKIMKYPP